LATTAASGVAIAAVVSTADHGAGVCAGASATHCSDDAPVALSMVVITATGALPSSTFSDSAAMLVFDVRPQKIQRSSSGAGEKSLTKYRLSLSGSPAVATTAAR
jgi:hypothetical protein